MADFHPVSIKFDGGIASVGRLHLYEYSRSQYALSRFITVVERYRLTGEVIDRVTSKKTVDMVVSAPQRGSFGLEVLVPLIQPVSDQLRGIAFDALFSYVWRRLLPPSPATENLAVELAKIELSREKERTKQIHIQQQSETERINLLVNMSSGHDLTTQRMLDVVERALDSQDQRFLAAGYDTARLVRERDMLKADLESERYLDVSEHQLRAVPTEDLNRLTAKLRPMVPEIALPLRSSASVVSVGTPANDNKFIRLDAERVKRIGERSIDAATMPVVGLIRSYDRFSRRGKLESDEFQKTMYFSLDFNDESTPKKVIAAMNSREVTCICNAYRDSAGQITSFLLRDILD